LAAADDDDALSCKSGEVHVLSGMGGQFVGESGEDGGSVDEIPNARGDHDAAGADQLTVVHGEAECVAVDFDSSDPASVYIGSNLPLNPFSIFYESF
jgi:hypothetical protein